MKVALGTAAGMAAAGSIFAAPAAAGFFELTGQVAGELRAFPQSALDSAQHETNGAFSIAPELYYETDSRAHAFTTSPFVRLDLGDEERTHFDVREAYWLWAGDTVELRAGLRQVFWGVTESQHLVDVLNQTDLVENPDGEDKLGQPMVDLTWIGDFGVIELYLLPGFRERTFPGGDGRLRAVYPIGDALYESDAEEYHVDGAARWSRTFGAWDVALSHFHGTSREPGFVPATDGPADEGSFELRPFYAQIDQTGLELQAVFGGWLLKGEAIRREGGGQTFTASVFGFEYTFVGALGTAADVGVIGEYHVDDRGDEATTPFEDDFFVGTRVALNDVPSTEILAGAIKDRDTASTLLSLEASRRFGDRWRLYVEYRGFTGAPSSDPFFGLRRDDYLQVELARFF